MSKASHLREQAHLCRRIARIPTAGGHHEDRVLLAIADDLEHEAAALEESDRPTPAAEQR
jgi:hypothetical protein